MCHSLPVVPALTSLRSLKCSQSADAHAACAQSSWALLLGLLSQGFSTFSLQQDKPRGPELQSCVLGFGPGSIPGFEM